jgi:uncharacterized protein (TIGR02466 family)
MIEPVIQPIFPVPVVLSQLERDWTAEEKQFFAKQNSKQMRNIGNSMSKNNYVLNEPEMAGLKAEIDVVLKQYVDNIIIPESDDVEIYVTQSWMNWTRKGEYHHRHTHSNSYLSGVVYINADEKIDKIVFINDVYRTIKFAHKETNHFNTETWNFTSRPGMLVLFPSWLTHMVEIKGDSHNNTRVSLAFNTFVRGTLGANKSLTELKL